MILSVCFPPSLTLPLNIYSTQLRHHSIAFLLQQLLPQILFSSHILPHFSAFTTSILFLVFVRLSQHD